MENVQRLGLRQSVECKLMTFEKVCSYSYGEDEEIVYSYMKV